MLDEHQAKMLAYWHQHYRNNEDLLRAQLAFSRYVIVALGICAGIGWALYLWPN